MTVAYSYKGPYLADVVAISNDASLQPESIRGRVGLLEAHSYDFPQGTVTVHCFPPGVKVIPAFGGGIRVTLELRFVELEEI